MFAALDLGTNNCRLLVARRSGEGFRVVDAFSRIVRLGEGLSRDNLLSEPAMARSIEALHVCASKLRRREHVHFRGVATEACRRAHNGMTFLSRVRDETGLMLEPIAPAEEANLALAGCAPLLDTDRPNAIVFDIGGGSTEVMWLARGDGGGGWRIVDFVSMPCGVVPVSERFGPGVVAPQVYEEMVLEIAAGLADLDMRHSIAARVAAGDVDMLGTSGTVTTLSGLAMGLARYQRDRVDGSSLDFDAMRRHSLELASQDFETRARHPCIGRERADLVVAGCAVLEGICRRWPVGRLRVADRGLREGILLGMMREAGA
ncbi:MAG: Ppx/GppA family phosphatase [Proteobacteria bacterium]|nr:Ppx/GppA family phosphatase [Pseudomonadota bacterium]